MQRFYGGSIDWLSTPCRYLTPYAVMMPILQAEERLAAYEVGLLIGGRNYEEEDHKKILTGIRKQANSLHYIPLTQEQKEKNADIERLVISINMGMKIVDKRKKNQTGDNKNNG